MPRSVWRLVAWGITILVVGLCFLPGDDIGGPQVMDYDKLLHGLAFAAIGFAWVRSGFDLVGTLVLGLVLALGTELGQQYLVEGREGDVLDLAADVGGLLLGTLIAALLPRARTA